MANMINMLITVNDAGRITVDVRGPVNGKEGILEILNSARELVEQGNFSYKHRPGNGTQATRRPADAHDYQPDFSKVGDPCKVCGHGRNHLWHLWG